MIYLLFVADYENFINAPEGLILPPKIKEKALKILKNGQCTAVAGQNVYDEIAKKPTDILLKAYEKGDYVWDENDIYYFEKYDMPLFENFLSYCCGN